LQHGYRGIVFIIFIFLLTTSLVWGIQKPLLLEVINQEFHSHFKNLTGNSYTYYEVGQVLIQLAGETLNEIPPDQVVEKDLNQIINRFPLFSHLVLVKNGRISSKYPHEDLIVTKDWLQAGCEKTTHVATVMQVYRPIAGEAEQRPINAFIKNTQDDGCVIGLATYPTNVLFSEAIDSINTLSVDWSYTDQFGGGIVFGADSKGSIQQNPPSYLLSNVFTKGHTDNGIVPTYEWQNEVEVGQFQHRLQISVSPELLMGRLLPNLLITLLLCGIFALCSLLLVLSLQKQYSYKMASAYEQINHLVKGNVERARPSGKQVPKGGSFDEIKAAIEKLRHQLLSKNQLLSNVEKINEAESTEALADILRNDPILQAIGEAQLTLHPVLSYQPVLHLTLDSMVIPPASESSEDSDKNQSPRMYSVDHDVRGNAVHRFVFFHNQKKLGTFSCMPKADLLSRSDQQYLDILARQISCCLQRLEMEALQRLSKVQWQRILEKFPFAVIILTNQLRLFKMNRQAAELAFVNERSMSINANLDDFVKDRDIVQQIKQFSTSKTTSASVSTVENGNRVIQFTRTSNNEKDAESSIMVWIQDISEEMEKFSSQANMLTTITHRLNHELGIIGGQLQLFANSGSLNSSQALHYEQIVRSLDDITTFIREASADDRFCAEKNGKRKPVNLIDVVIQAIRYQKPFADQSKVAVSFTNQLEYDESTVLADQIMLTEAFKNIIDNAIRYNAIGGEVHISMAEEKSFIIVRIKDTGAGLSALDIARISSEQPLTAGVEGTIKFGAGLRIAKSIITQHGGKLLVESIQGEGSTFSLLIPINS